MPKILNRVGTLTISLLVNYVNQERALNTICKNRFLALSSLKTNSMPYEKKNIETPKKKPMIIPVKNAVPAWTKTKVRNIMRDSKYPELHGELYLG